MESGQATVVEERCIACGTCIRECPQEAKGYRGDIEKARGLLQSAPRVAVSLAPSFAAAWKSWEWKRLPSALRRIGFSHVSETAIGAWHVARETAKTHQEHPDQVVLGSSCPAVVRYIEKYRPEQVGQLARVCSPMVAHGRLLKAQLGEETLVVFIGPCVAKKAEAERGGNREVIDCVLTFDELMEWLKQEGIDLGTCEESEFDVMPRGEARYYPLLGGSLRTANLPADLLTEQALPVSGIDEVEDVLSLPGHNGGGLVEPLFCSQGCINGPVMPEGVSVFQRRRRLMQYARERADSVLVSKPVETEFSLLTTFRAAAANTGERITEEAIRTVLEKTGKAEAENRLNCGACGYASCRDKAAAVLRGLAEAEMCIPYMRRLAERRTDRIIETSPNGIVILDEHLNILSMNPAFRRMFMCSEAILGRPISYLMDPASFERLAAGEKDRIESVVDHQRYNCICHQVLYPLKEEKQYVGIFVNVTETRHSREKLDQLRADTVMRARELLDHQIEMAQRIANLVGESTAKGEALVEQLVDLADESPRSSKRNQFSWDTSTSTR
jgi:PAS domain S-box-containing protein